MDVVDVALDVRPRYRQRLVRLEVTPVEIAVEVVGVELACVAGVRQQVLVA